MNIDQSAMSYTSMNLSRRALQTNGKFFSNFEIIFESLVENENIFKGKKYSNPIISMSRVDWSEELILIF